jgi:hypothetical protein
MAGSTLLMSKLFPGQQVLYAQPLYGVGSLFRAGQRHHAGAFSLLAFYTSGLRQTD